MSLPVTRSQLLQPAFDYIVLRDNDEAQRFLPLKKHAIHNSRSSRNQNDRRHNKRQRPETSSRLSGGFVSELSKLLRDTAAAGHAKREVAVEFVSNQAPQAAHLLDAFYVQTGIPAQFTQPVRAVPKIIMRLLVQAE